MNKLLWILLVAFCLLVVDAKKKTAEQAVKSDDTPAAPEEDAPAEEDADEEQQEEKDDDDKKEEKKEEVADVKDEDKDETQNEDAVEGAENSSEETDENEQSPEMACNLKFKRVGCYADNSKKDRPLRSNIMTDVELGSKKGKLPKGDRFNKELPKFACKCANEAINAGNAIFGLQNIAECWTGPDDSKYDKDGPSEECVTFDYASCGDSEMCAGKKHANFVYYVDTPEHTKTKEEIAKEYAEYKRKIKLHHKKLNKRKAKKAKKAKKAAKHN